MTFFEELRLLFSEMSPWTPILLLAGILLIIIDSFDAGFDIPGALGLLAIVAGIAVRMLNGGTLLMLAIMLFFVIVIIFVSVYFIFRSAEKGWLSKTPLFDKSSSVPFDKTEGTPDYSHLLGKVGEAVTVLKPVGKIKIEDNIYDAVSETKIIEAGACVEVVVTNGYLIVVRSK